MKFIKKNLYIIVASVIFVVAVATSAVIVLLNKDVNIGDSTSIGHIYLGNMTEEERKQAINEGISTWQRDIENSGGYVVSYQGKTYSFNIADYLNYDELNTITLLQEGRSDNRVFFSADESRILELETEIAKALFGSETGMSNVINRGSVSGTLQAGTFWYDVLDVAGQFYSHYEFDLYNYLYAITNNPAKYAEAATITLNTTGYEDEVKNIMDSLGTIGHNLTQYSSSEGFIEVPQTYKGIMVLKDQRNGFSLLDYVENNGMQLKSSELSIVGTGLTAVAVQSNFKNIRRSADISMPSYSYMYEGAIYGIATKISIANNQDLTFYNNDTYDYNIKIEANETGSELTFTIIGPQFVSGYTVTEVVEEKKYATVTVDVTDSELAGAEITNNAQLSDFKTNLVSRGYVLDTNFAESLQLGADKVVYVQTIAGVDGAEVSYTRNVDTFTFTSSEVDGETVTTVNDIDVSENALKVASYAAQTETKNYVILDVTYVG